MNEIKERKAILIIGGVLAVVFLVLFIVSLRIPVVQSVSAGYPKVEFSEGPEDVTVDNVLLKKEVAISGVVLKCFSETEVEKGDLNYLAHMDEFTLFIKASNSEYASDDMYNVYADLLGEDSGESLKDKSTMKRIKSGYLGQSEVVCRCLEMKKGDSMMVFDIDIAEAKYHIYYGIKYAADTEESNLQNVVNYVCDSIRSLEIISPYENVNRDEMSPEEREELEYADMKERAKQKEKLAAMSEEELQEYRDEQMADAFADADSSDADEYIQGDEDVPFYSFGTTLAMKTSGEPTYVYIQYEGTLDKKTDVTILDPKGKEYYPIKRFVLEELDLEGAVYKIDAQKEGEDVVPLEVHASESAVWAVTVIDMGSDYDLNTISGTPYDEYFENK